MAEETEFQDAVEEESPQQGDPSEDYYNYLKKAGADVAPTYQSFKNTLSDTEKAKKYYDYLKTKKFDVPDTYDSFARTLGVMSESAIPKIDYSKPIQQKPIGEKTTPPIFVPASIPKETNDVKLARKHQEAINTLQTELTGNSDLIPSLIKNQKQKNAQLAGTAAFAQRPASDAPLTKVQQLDVSLQPKPQEQDASDQEIQDYDQNIQQNQDAGRAFLQHVVQSKPDKAKSIQEATYLHDAMDRLSKDPNAGQKGNKVLQNAHEISKGNLHYNMQGGVLIKPEDTWDAIKSGLQQKNKAFTDYDLFNKSTPDQAITELEKRRSEHDPDEPIPVPKGFMAELGGGIAGQPIRGLVAGKVAGGITLAIPGAEEFAPAVDKFVAMAQSGDDFRRISYAHSLQQNYNQLRNDGVAPDMAYAQAQDAAKKESLVDATAGAAMIYGAGAIGGIKLPSFVASNGFKSAVVTALKQGAKGVGEAGAIGLIQGVAQQAKNDIKDEAGIVRDYTGKDIQESIESGTFFTLGMAVLAKGGSLLSKKTRISILQGLAKATPEQIQQELGNQIMEKHITPEEATQTEKEINDHRELDQSIPSNITQENRLKILDQIDKRKELEDQLETKDKAYHTDIKEKIKTINENILELSKEKIPKGEEPELTIPEPEVSSEKPPESAATNEPPSGAAPSISTGDIIISEHLTGPQRVRSVSEDGKTVFVEGAADHHVHEIPIEEITLKVKQNAKGIRTNQSTAGEEGPAGEGGENPRSKDIQLATEQTSGDGKTTQPPGEGEIGKPPINMHDLPFEPEAEDVTRLAHKNTEELYEELGTSGRIPRETKEDTKLESDADELIKKGYDFEGKATKVLDGEEKFSDTEQVAFAKMVGALKAKLKQLNINDPEFDRIQDKIELLTRASDKVGSETGAALRARRMFVLNDQTLSDFIRQDKESMGVDELTTEQKAKNKSEHEDISKAQAEYDKKVADLEEENAKLRAQAEIKKSKSGSKSSGKKTHEEHVKDRQSIIEAMRADLLKAAKGQGGLTASVPGAAQLVAIAPHVMKLVKSLVEEGVDKLEDVVKSIHADLKDVVEGISEKDIHNIIAGDYEKSGKTKNELSEKLRDLKTLAKLQNRFEDLNDGIEPKREKDRIERNKEIAALKKQIKEHPLTRLAKTKDITERQIKEVEEQLLNDDFEKKEKEPVELDNEAKLLKDKLNSLKQEREVRILKQQYANRTRVQKTLDVIAEIGNTPRAIMSSMDFSAPLRQGLWGVTKQLFNRPGDLGRQFTFMFRSAKSQRVFDRWFYELKEAPDYEILKQSGLPLSDPHDPKLTAKEEAFMSNYAERIPVVGKLIKASENAYIGFLNKMRVDLFRRATDAFASDGKTFANSPELYKAMADYIGAATGRGKMPEVLENSTPILSAMFFSPRLIASRMNLLTNWFNPKFYTKVPKEVRVQYFKDMAKFIGLGVTILGLAKAAGAEVEDDPRSSDFGKIKSGNTRWDVWGGFQQYVRLASQLISGQKKSTTSGSIMELNGQYPSKQTRLDALLQFGRGKLAPLPAEVADLLAGKDVTGKPATLGSELMKNVPLVLNDIYEAYKDNGVQGALGVGIPSMFGVGVQTYGENKKGETGGGGAKGSYKIKEWQP